MYGELSSVVVVCSTLLSQVNELPDQYLFKNDLNKECRSSHLCWFFFLFCFVFLKRVFDLLIGFDALNI